MKTPRPNPRKPSTVVVRTVVVRSKRASKTAPILVLSARTPRKPPTESLANVLVDRAAIGRSSAGRMTPNGLVVEPTATDEQAPFDRPASASTPRRKRRASS